EWRYLGRHPKARTYKDLPDFAFYRLNPVSALLNGGFARAFRLDAGQLLAGGPVAALAEAERRAVDHMNSDHADAIDLYATHYLGESGTGWRMTGVDTAGIDMALGDRTARIDFDAPLED